KDVDRDRLGDHGPNHGDEPQDWIEAEAPAQPGDPKHRVHQPREDLELAVEVLGGHRPPAPGEIRLAHSAHPVRFADSEPAPRVLGELIEGWFDRLTTSGRIRRG